MIKVLAKSIREYKKPSILTPILVTGEVIMECIIPFVTANLVNDIKNGCSMGELIRYGIALLVMAALSLTFGALAGSFCSTASCGFARNLRKDMFYKIQGYSFENIDKFSVSSLVTRLTTDVTNVQMAYMMIVRTAIRCPLMLIFSFVMGVVMGGKMAFIFLFTIPVLGVGLILVIRKTMPLFRRVFKKYDALNNSVQENIRGMRVVKSYVREEYEKQKFNAAAENVQADFTKAERILALNNPLMQLCIYAVMVFVLSFGSYLVITTRGLELDVGQMSSLLTYSFQILMSLMMLSMVFVMITMATESAQRIVEVLSEESAVQSPPNPVEQVKDGSIDFEGVSFKYSKSAERTALSNINLHIRSGEVIGIIGGTGSSKTSLIQLIPRLYDATEGVVKVGGVDVRDYDLEALRNQVAVVLQKNELFSGTIKENLRWGNPERHRRGAGGGLPSCPGRRIHPVSSPTATIPISSRAAPTYPAARSSAYVLPAPCSKSPRSSFLDDSTSAVDTRTDALIRQAFRQYIPETTKLIIAQRVASVQDADRIVVMDGGAIDAVGTHEELLAVQRDLPRGVTPRRTREVTNDEQE